MTATESIAKSAKEFITLCEAAKRIPGRPHASTLTRWAHKGVRGTRLATYRSGNRLFTTQEDIDKFLNALNTSQDEQLAAEGC